MAAWFANTNLTTLFFNFFAVTFQYSFLAVKLVDVLDRFP